jgi:hypothetical protein
MTNVSLKFKVTDERPPIVLDDVAESRFAAVAAMTAHGVPAVVEVTDTKKREADQEYVKDTPYKTTSVSGVVLPPALGLEKVTVDRPSPGTPPDALYLNPTVPSAEHPYAFKVADDKYPLPMTVYRPAFEYIGAKTVIVGRQLQFTVVANTPAPGAQLTYSVTRLPAGASFDAATRTVSWTPSQRQVGVHEVAFTVNDGVLPESVSATIVVRPAAKP